MRKLYMLERRNSNRVQLKDIWVKEENGDFQFSLEASNISEEGIYLAKKLKTRDQEPFSTLSLLLPNGKSIKNVCARMVREDLSKNKPSPRGYAFEFLNMTEEVRLELKRFLHEKRLYSFS